MKKYNLLLFIIMSTSICLQAENKFTTKNYILSSPAETVRNNETNPFGKFIIGKFYGEYIRNKYQNGATFGFGFAHANLDENAKLHPEGKTKWFLNQFYYSLMPQFSYFIGTKLLTTSTNAVNTNAYSINATLSYSLLCCSFRLQQDYFIKPNLPNSYSISPQVGLFVSIFQLHIGPSFNIGSNNIKPVTMAFSTGLNVPLFRIKLNK